MQWPIKRFQLSNLLSSPLQKNLGIQYVIFYGVDYKCCSIGYTYYQQMTLNIHRGKKRDRFVCVCVCVCVCLCLCAVSESSVRSRMRTRAQKTLDLIVPKTLIF